MNFVHLAIAEFTASPNHPTLTPIFLHISHHPLHLPIHPHMPREAADGELVQVLTVYLESIQHGRPLENRRHHITLISSLHPLFSPLYPVFGTKRVLGVYGKVLIVPLFSQSFTLPYRVSVDHSYPHYLPSRTQDFPLSRPPQELVLTQGDSTS